MPFWMEVPILSVHITYSMFTNEWVVYMYIPAYILQFQDIEKGLFTLSYRKWYIQYKFLSIYYRPQTWVTATQGKPKTSDLIVRGSLPLKNKKITNIASSYQWSYLPLSHKQRLWWTCIKTPSKLKFLIDHKDTSVLGDITCVCSSCTPIPIMTILGVYIIYS